LDSETRAARIAACEAKMGALILSLSHEPFDDCRGAACSRIGSRYETGRDGT
jgi:hypothetical protein